jgi:hypothetical protein
VQQSAASAATINKTNKSTERRAQIAAPASQVYQPRAPHLVPSSALLLGSTAAALDTVLLLLLPLLARGHDVAAGRGAQQRAGHVGGVAVHQVVVQLVAHHRCQAVEKPLQRRRVIAGQLPRSRRGPKAREQRLGDMRAECTAGGEVVGRKG